MQEQVPRVVMIGDSSVGKTSIVGQLCQGKWTGDTRATVSTTFYTLKGDSGDQTLQIWDTAGAERYRALNSVYYHNAMGGILVFDLTSRQSYESLESWISEFTQLAQPGAIVAIVGNKVDLLPTAEERVKPDEGEKWAKSRGLRYFSTSAKDGTGIDQLREYIVTSVPQLKVCQTSIDLTQKKTEKESKGCCK